MLQQIWKLNAKKVAELFVVSKDLPEEDRKKAYTCGDTLCTKKRPKLFVESH